MNTRKPSRPTTLEPVGPRWLLPTNHRNLMYWLAAGLILPESAMNKYYRDCLHDVPGWLPLFRDRVPQTALDAATSEGGTAVLLDFDLVGMSGPVKTVTSEGVISDGRLPKDLPEDIALILAPAPLPVHRIQKATFPSKKALDDYHLSREETPNTTSFEIPLTQGPYPSQDDLINRLPWPPKGIESPPVWPAKIILHEGAIRALLFGLGNRGESSLGLAMAAFAEAGPLLLKNEVFRMCLNEILEQGVRKHETAEMRRRLFWGVVDHLQALQSGEAEPKTEPKQGILDYLGTQVGGEEGHGSRPLRELANDLQKLGGMGSGTISELLEKHPGPFAHALLLFFLRQDADELFDFPDPGDYVTEADRLAAALLFGLREDWLKMPERLRAIPWLYPAIAHRMAASAHRCANTGIDLGEAPDCPTLREMFSTRPWSKRQEDAAIELSRELGWKDTLETRVQLGAGHYRLEVEKSGVQIVLPGEVKAVTTKVLPDRFLEQLAGLNWPLVSAIEKKARDILQKP